MLYWLRICGQFDRFESFSCLVEFDQSISLRSYNFILTYLEALVVLGLDLRKTTDATQFLDFACPGVINDNLTRICEPRTPIASKNHNLVFVERHKYGIDARIEAIFGKREMVPGWDFADKFTARSYQNLYRIVLLVFVIFASKHINTFAKRASTCSVPRTS